KLANRDPQDIIQYIFAAGLSTAENVSDLSGRGVGMDVVRSSVEHLGGKVHVQSRLGEGCTITLTLPLTISISKVMTFTLCGQTLAVPINSVAATKRVPKAAIQRIKHYDTFLWRRKTVPLVSLADILELSGQTNQHEYVSVLIVRHYNDFVGLVVDEFQEGVDVILKPLEGVLARLQCYEGSALLGDGSVLLLLNLKGLL
ncbi:MAG: chemotaxis protein CheA, partial [Candidatus Electrothrix sp. ATG2]|nr:chemotaxis protein CheA [Candidatus Electrothrix sp. ATG2]